MKKFIVLGVLFILPIVAYLFFASGVHNFAKLPVIEEEIPELNLQQDVRLENKITVLGFLGNTIERDGGDLFNLNQKIFKSFSGFDDFQFVYLVPESIDQDALEKVTYELSQLVDLSNWYFIQTAQTNINTVFNSLNTPYSLQEDGGSPYIFIIDNNN